MLGKKDIEEVIDRIPYQKIEGCTFLITGANGFLASNLVHTLMYLNKYYFNKKCMVIALCRNREKAMCVFSKYLDNVYFKLCIQSVEEKISLDEEVDYIIHAASNAVTSDFRKVPADILDANIIGTSNLLKFSKTKRLKGFLFFSSGAVYGEVPGDVSLVKEEDAFELKYSQTDSCYAEGKRAGEALCRSYWEQYKIPTKIVRISHTYGPGINLNDGRVFSDFIKSICNGKKLVIKGSGNDTRPFCYITDALVAFFLVLIEGQNGEAYNMANSHETVTIYELAKKLTTQAFPMRNLEIEAPHLEKGAEIKKIMVDTEKLQKLGWIAKVDIIEGFRRTVLSFEEVVQ